MFPTRIVDLENFYNYDAAIGRSLNKETNPVCLIMLLLWECDSEAGRDRVLRSPSFFGRLRFQPLAKVTA